MRTCVHTHVSTYVHTPHRSSKKISGILTETVIQGNYLAGVILGIGVNLNSSLSSLSKIDQPAISLSVLLDKFIDKDEFLALFLEEFYLNYRSVLDLGFSHIRLDYLQRAMFLGKKTKIMIFDEFFEGKVIDIDDFGQLILETSEGLRSINIGDMIC